MPFRFQTSLSNGDAPKKRGNGQGNNKRNRFGIALESDPKEVGNAIPANSEGGTGNGSCKLGSRRSEFVFIRNTKKAFTTLRTDKEFPVTNHWTSKAWIKKHTVTQIVRSSVSVEAIPLPKHWKKASWLPVCL